MHYLGENMHNILFFLHKSAKKQDIILWKIACMPVLLFDLCDAKG